MPAMAPPSTDERALLLAFLDVQRHAVQRAAFGLTDAQAGTVSAASALTVGGLVKNLTDMERNWTAITRGDKQDHDATTYLSAFQVAPEETLADLIAADDTTARETDALISDRSLDDAVPVPKGVPWFPAGVDGATAYPLLAAAEGWPPTPWLTPWSPEPVA